jgi:hypothetical protein
LFYTQNCATGQRPAPKTKYFNLHIINIFLLNQRLICALCLAFEILRKERTRGQRLSVVFT